jgi:hypothetical protein
MSRSAIGPVLATIVTLVISAESCAADGSVSAGAERAISAYVTACLGHDETALRAVTTPDVRVDDGPAFTMNQAALLANCASVPRCWPLTLSNITVVSVGNADYFLAQYDLIAAPLSTPWRHAHVLIEMRGDRIARITELEPTPALTRNAVNKE